MAIVATLVLAAGWALLQLAMTLQAVLIPLAIAGITAYLLDPLVVLAQQRLRLPRVGAILLLLGLLAGIFFGFLLFLVPLVIEQTTGFIEGLPRLIQEVRQTSETFLQEHPILNEQLKELQNRLATDWPNYTGAIASYLWAGLGGILSSLGFVLGLVIIPLYIFYFLRDKASIEANWQEYVPIHRSRLRDEALVIVKEINRHMIAFFRGQLVVALILGLLTGLGLSLIGLKYAVLIGVITATFSIIPYLGVVLSIAPALLIAWVQSGGSIGYVLLTAAVFTAVQMAEGMFISPKIMGDRTGLHPVTVIVCILVWTILLGGLLGAILAVPLTATLKVLMFRYIWKPAEAA
ncbi:MAG: AI-2E family transporter [Verrucomicrobiia bacterium]